MNNPLKPLPSCEQTEKSILSIAIEHAAKCLPILAATVPEDYFYYPAARVIYSAMLEEYRDGREISFMSMVVKATRGEIPCQPSEFAELTILSVSPSHFPHYLTRLRNAAVYRNGIAAAEKLVKEAMDADLSDDPIPLMSDACAAMQAAQLTASIDTGIPVKKLWAGLFEALEHGTQASPPVPTGFPPIDRSTRGGPRRGQLVVVAAFRHVGKTAFLRQIALQTAEAGFNVIAFMMESSEEEESVNTMAAQANVAVSDISPGTFMPTAGIVQKIHKAASSTLSLRIDTSGRQTVESISAKCRLAKAAGGLDVIIVDYLQLLASRPAYRTQTREQIISEDAAELKRLARELNCVLYVGAQLVDAAGLDSTTPPEMHHVRECKAIANHCDVFLGMNAPEGIAHDPTGPARGVLRDIYSRKWRGVGAFDRPFQMNFHGSTQRFHPMA